MPEGEEAQSKVMAAWGAWFQNLGPALADGGNPTSQTKTIASDGSVSDGGGANPSSGYSLIEADGIDAAVALAKGCPVLGGGASHRGRGNLQRHVVGVGPGLPVRPITQAGTPASAPLSWRGTRGVPLVRSAVPKSRQ